ncbi:Os03g0687000, partial [Oryza sativa Japonica Group]
ILSLCLLPRVGRFASTGGEQRWWLVREDARRRRRRRRRRRGGRPEAEEHGRRQAGERRRQARPQVPRLEGHALHHRERDVREAGDAGDVGEPAGVPDAGVPHAERGRGDAAQRPQRHHQPRPHHRRLPLRRLPRPLPRPRHRLRRLPHRHVLADDDGRRGRAAPGGVRGGGDVLEGDVGAVRGAVHVVRVPGAGVGGDPAVQHAVRRRPVRPPHGVRQARHQQLLQLVLLHLHLRHARLRHRHHLRPEQRQLAHRPRHPHRAHAPRLRPLLHGHQALRPRHPRGLPLHQHRPGVRRRGEEAVAQAAQGPQAGPVRPAAHQRHRHQAGAHGPVPVPRQGGHRVRPRRRARRGRRAVEPVEAVQRAAGGGGEVPHPHRARLVHGDHLLRRRRAAVDLRGVVRAAVRPTPRPELPDPRGVVHGVRHAGADAVDPHLRPPPRAAPPQGHGQGRGPHPPAAAGDRDRAVDGGDGDVGRGGGPEAAHRADAADAGDDHHRGRHLGHVQPVDGAAAHGAGALGGVQPHQPDRVLLQGDPGAHAERGRRARLLQPGAGELPQWVPRHHRAPDHRRREQLAGAGPQQGEARPLLLDDRRHRHLQHHLLHDLRQVVQVQGGSRQLRCK